MKSLIVSKLSLRQRPHEVPIGSKILDLPLYLVRLFLLHKLSRDAHSELPRLYVSAEAQRKQQGHNSTNTTNAPVAI